LLQLHPVEQLHGLQAHTGPHSHLPLILVFPAAQEHVDAAVFLALVVIGFSLLEG
jgi:hypothetical protein